MLDLFTNALLQAKILREKQEAEHAAYKKKRFEDFSKECNNIVPIKKKRKETKKRNA